VTCPAPYEDHDLWHERVQCVHLHGSVLDPAKGYTFTLEDFAGQTAQPTNPWYQAMADDMMSRTFLFVGTRLNEPPFYHYLSLRSQRGRGTQEVRAKAFVVSPNVSTIRRRQLEDHGFAVFDATGEVFFGTLLPLVNNLVPDRLTLLKNRYPHQVTAISQGLLEQQSELLRQFDFVTPEPPPPERETVTGVCSSTARSRHGTTSLGVSMRRGRRWQIFWNASKPQTMK
jgi:hypothetical protein